MILVLACNILEPFALSEGGVLEPPARLSGQKRHLPSFKGYYGIDRTSQYRASISMNL